MLINCPECELQVSDKAVFCPHCGNPFAQNSSAYAKRTIKKRMRLPNGFGQITEIKGKNLREPFRAMVTVGKNAYGKPIARMLKPKAYFATYNEAYAALVEYHKHPYDFDINMTVGELYELWSKQHFEKFANPSSIRNIKSVWAYCGSAYTIPVRDLKARHIKYCVNEGVVIVNGEVRKASPNVRTRIKSVFNTMLDFAVEYEIVDKNVSRDFNLDAELVQKAKTVENIHIPYTEEEIAKLWENINAVECADMVLVQCYSGWRPKELCELKNENINLEEMTMAGGVKTNAGKNRVVPIHPAIKNIITERYDKNEEYLFNTRKGTGYSYAQFAYRFGKLVKELGLDEDHKPHDGRKHFITRAKESGVDEYAIKRIVGHEISDITERVYTERSVEWLHQEIAKIK